jgi:predicted acyl esterase
VARNLTVTTADGARLLIDHHTPEHVAGRAVVWIRTPYGRKGIASIANRFANAGAHVLVEAVRGTDGSDGTFDGVTFPPQDGVRRLRPLDPPAGPDGTRTVVIDLIGMAHCFRAGHRLRLQISSGAHPRLVRNTGTGEPLATATELRPADQEVFHDPAHPSVLTLPCREWG